MAGYGAQRIAAGAVTVATSTGRAPAHAGGPGSSSAPTSRWNPLQPCAGSAWTRGPLASLQRAALPPWAMPANREQW